MAKDAIATAPVAAPSPSPAPAAPAPAHANAVANVPIPKPEGKTVEDTSPVVRQYNRQYKTDFDDGSAEPGARDMPSVQDIDAAMPRGEEGTETVAEAVAEVVAEKVGMARRTATPPEETPANDAAAEPPAAVEAPKPNLLSREERRKLLSDLSAESERRTQEQTVHAEKARIAGLEAKLKGPLADRLAVVFPELAGQPDTARDRLIEMLVAGQVTPAFGEAAPAAAAEPDAIAELRREIAELKGTAPNNPENVAAARLRHVVSSMKEAGTALPFSEREGNAAYDMGVKVAKSMYAMQGNKGQVDGARVMQVVEEHFEEQFVSKYGQEAADFLKGRKPAAPVAAVATPAAVAPAQRRPNGRRGNAAAPGGDPLPLDPARRHRMMMAEIDQAEGTVRVGPR